MKHITATITDAHQMQLDFKNVNAKKKGGGDKVPTASLCEACLGEL